MLLTVRHWVISCLGNIVFSLRQMPNWGNEIDGGHPSFHSSILSYKFWSGSHSTNRVRRAVQCFSQQQALPWGSLSATRTDWVCNPFNMFWVCLGFSTVMPRTLPMGGSLTSQAAPFRGVSGLIPWASQITELLSVNWGYSPCREISPLVSTILMVRNYIVCNSRIPLWLVLTELRTGSGHSTFTGECLKFIMAPAAWSNPSQISDVRPLINSWWH